jgi:hypothetical protein
MAQKPQSNHGRFLEVLRSMSPADRLLKAFELTELARARFRAELKQRFPDKSDAELHELYVARLSSEERLPAIDYEDVWRAAHDGH